MLGDKRFLKSIRLRNLLSFGPATPELELKSLNVLIGPNGTGKSNLIEAIGLLKAAPGKLFEPIQSGGGIKEWIWKGIGTGMDAEITSVLEQPGTLRQLRHQMRFTEVGQRAELVDESIEGVWPVVNDRQQSTHLFLYRDGVPVLLASESSDPGSGMKERILRREDLAPNLSVIAQRKEPDQYPALAYLGQNYERIKMFREWNLGRTTQPRRPQQTDLPGDFLTEDASNLALVINDLEHRGTVRAELLEKLKAADGEIEDCSTRVHGGTVQVYLHYRGLEHPIPATRLSDGTIRYLCVLSVLCHPEPPPLVCMEEPELGLHPDLLPGLADLLVEASHRMQLIVTTHSDILVDALTSTPEAVIVCEKQPNGATVMRRLEEEGLHSWLQEYGLGQLWRKGEIGGNRW